MFLLSWLVVDNVRYYNKYSVLSANLMALVRHEVACVFIKELKIRCSATGTLPGRASGVTPGCEAPGTR